MSKPIQLSWKGLTRRNVTACKTQEIALRNDLGGLVRSKDLWSRFDDFCFDDFCFDDLLKTNFDEFTLCHFVKDCHGD